MQGNKVPNNFHGKYTSEQIEIGLEYLQIHRIIKLLRLCFLRTSAEK